MAHDKISTKTIEKIAHMAKLHVTDQELDKYADISHIFEFIGQIDQLDAANVPPMAHPLNLTQRLRDDKVTEINQRDFLQSTVSDRVEAGVYLVPQALEGKKE